MARKHGFFRPHVAGLSGIYSTTLIEGGGGWTPAVLFANGEKGGWWEPFRISTLAQSSDGTGAVSADADPVGYLRDLSPNGRNAVQATAGNRMLFRPSVYNGLGGIEGAVAGKQLVAASVFDSSFNTAISLYGVVKRPTTSSTKIWASHTGARLYAGITGVSTPTINTSATSDTQITTVKADDEVALISFRYDGATKKLRAIGPERQTANDEAATGVINFSGGSLTIGDLSSGSFDWDGQICAILVVNEALSDNEDYLTCKYYRDLFDLSPDIIVCCDGNSLTYGTGASDPATESYPAQLAALQPGWTVKNFGAPSNTTAQRATAAPTEIDTYYGDGRPKNVAVLWEITNDLYFGGVVADAITRYVSWCQGRQAAGYSVVAATVLPRSDAGTPGSFEADRQTANTYIRANWASFADALADVAADTRIGDAGDELDTTYYNADKVHLNATGYGVVAGIIQTAVLSL